MMSSSNLNLSVSDLWNVATSNKSASIELVNSGTNMRVSVTANAVNTAHTTPGFFVENISVLPYENYTLSVRADSLVGNCFFWVGGRTNILNRQSDTLSANSISSASFSPLTSVIRAGVLFAHAKIGQYIDIRNFSLKLTLNNDFIRTDTEEITVPSISVATMTITSDINGPSTSSDVQSVTSSSLNSNGTVPRFSRANHSHALTKIRQIITVTSDVILPTADLVSVITNTPIVGGTVIFLPVSSSVGECHQVTIVDEAGKAGEPNQSISIHVSVDGSDLIIGSDTFVLLDNYNSVTLFTNGTGEWFIGSL